MLTPEISILTLLIIGFIIFDFILETILDTLNAKTWDIPIPKELEGIYDEEKYAKAKKYHQATQRISTLSTIISTVLTIAVLWWKGFAFVHIYITQFTLSPILQAVLFFGVFAVASSIIGLPFELYSIFVIEEKFGFNKMTWKTYLSDKIKGILLGASIGGILLSLFV